MRPIQHERVKDVFFEACLRPAAARGAYVVEACGRSKSLRREVESLLRAYGGDSSTPPHRRARAASRGRFRRGQVLGGRFRIVRLIGRGGMGEVYAARDLLLQLPIALKVLRASAHAQPDRMLEEVRLARRISHPSVCRVYDVGVHDGTPFLTMELIVGEDLATRVARTGAWASADVAAIGVRLAEALAAAHEAGVLHRDLKPANLLIDRSGGLHLTDFGIASPRRSGLPRRHADHFGTPGYMAPESLDVGSEPTETTDLYALGAVLYELATGAPLFDASDEAMLLEMHRTVEPERPSRRTPGIDPGLEAVIVSLLAKDPAARPASARAVASTLAALQGDSAAGAAPGPEMVKHHFWSDCDPTLDRDLVARRPRRGAVARPRGAAARRAERAVAG